MIAYRLLALAASIAAGPALAETRYFANPNPLVEIAPGAGRSEIVDGVEFWTGGLPRRSFTIVGVIVAERDSTPGKKRKAALGDTAGFLSTVRANALVFIDQKTRIAGIQPSSPVFSADPSHDRAAGIVSARVISANRTRLAVIRYVD